MATALRQGAPPRRLDDIQYFSYDKLRVTFAFMTGADPVDLTFTNLTARAIANNHPMVQQPTVTMEPTAGKVSLNWAADQVAQLPMYFLVVLSGAKAIGPGLVA